MSAAKRARSDGMLYCVDEDGDVEAIVVKCCWKPTYPEAETDAAASVVFGSRPSTWLGMLIWCKECNHLFGWLSAGYIDETCTTWIQGFGLEMKKKVDDFAFAFST